jgi:hypothetical protein
MYLCLSAVLHSLNIKVQICLRLFIYGGPLYIIYNVGFYVLWRGWIDGLSNRVASQAYFGCSAYLMWRTINLLGLLNLSLKNFITTYHAVQK